MTSAVAIAPARRRQEHGRLPSRGYPRRVADAAATKQAGSADARPDSEWWLTALRADGPERDYAIERLHELMVRAARFELGRRRAALSYVRGEQLDDIAMQAANDALVAVLAKLDDFRGASRFETWAYKFALLEAGVKLRRRPGRSARSCSGPTTGRRSSTVAAIARGARALRAARRAEDRDRLLR